MSQHARGPTTIRLPTDFPVAAYRSVYDRVTARANIDGYPEEWKQQFIGSALAVAYRFRACTRHEAAFVRSVTAAGNTPDEYDRYTQDQELFGFFVTGLAALESLYYCLFAVGARLAPATFPFASDADYRKIDPKRTAAQFTSALPGTLASELARVQSSQELDDWTYARNVLAHRVASGRIVYLWTQTPTKPHDIRIRSHTIPLTPHSTATTRSWLATSVSDILTAADAYVHVHF